MGGKRFLFEHFDGYSKAYNPQGTLKASEYILPVDDCSIDMVVCASLFTHLLEPDCIHYLMEIRRVLKPGGKSIISIHTQPVPGQPFSGDEARIDIEKQYFTKLVRAARLDVLEEVGVVYGQDLFVLETLQ